jgi:hypothetical protein
MLRTRAEGVGWRFKEESLEGMGVSGVMEHKVAGEAVLSQGT